MRTLFTLLALTLLAGCRMTSSTAPATIQPDAVSWQAPPHAAEWIVRHYEPNDRFPEIADLGYRIVGDKLVVEARFTGSPVAIGDDWFGNVQLQRGTDAFAAGGFDALRFSFGVTHINGGPPLSPSVIRIHGEEPDASWNHTAPASVVLRGPILRVTCNASLLDFSPDREDFAGVSHPFQDPKTSEFGKALGGAVAAVER